MFSILSQMYLPCQQSPYTGQLHYQMALLLVHLLTLCFSLGKFLCGYSSQKPPGEDIPLKPWLYQPRGQMALDFCQQGQHDCYHGHHGLYESLNWFWIDMLKTDGSPSQVTGELIDKWASGWSWEENGQVEHSLTSCPGAGFGGADW